MERNRRRLMLCKKKASGGNETTSFLVPLALTNPKLFHSGEGFLVNAKIAEKT